MSINLKLLAAVVAATLVAGAADARTVKWARGADALTLDPHAQNEGPTIAFNNQVYETLIARDNANKLIPGLAVSWKLAEPTVWEFKLRQGVKFHGGEDFTADDVVFSYQRALAPTSDYKGYLANTKEIVKVDDYTVQIKTNGPNPLVADNLTSVFIMSKKWAEAHNATKPQDFKNKEENFAVRNANGTGPFALVSREPDVKTVLKRNDAYWGRKEVPLEITELVLLPIKQDATRVAALLSGEVDVVQDVPVQDIERLKASPNLRVSEGPENRTIFFGFDVSSPELASSDVKGKNPFADVRVRQAVNIAINRQAIQRVVMRGQAVPAGSIAPPFVNGYKREFDTLPPVDIAKAKGLLATAGYPNGFSVTLHCPNDRYLNDEAICQAAVGMLGQIGIKINLVSQSKSLHFPTLQNLEVGLLHARLGRPDLRQRLHLQLSLPYARRDLWRLEHDALFQSGDRQGNRDAGERDRSREAQCDHRGYLEQVDRRASLRRDPPPDAGARDEERHRRAGAPGQHHQLQVRGVQEVLMMINGGRFIADARS